MEFGTNLKYLRQRRRLTQSQLAFHVKMNPSTIGAYERGRSLPKVESLVKLASFLNRPIDDLLKVHLETKDQQIPENIKGEKIRVLPIVVDSNDNHEKVALVPAKAVAGYTQGYADTEYIADLPKFRLPFSELAEERTYRVFQIEGDSMLPIKSRSYIICEYVQNWDDIEDGHPYVVATREEGIVFKRAYKEVEESVLLLKSDNVLYEPFSVPLNTVLELWKARGYVSFEFSESEK